MGELGELGELGGTRILGYWDIGISLLSGEVLVVFVAQQFDFWGVITDNEMRSIGTYCSGVISIRR
jgi:hypothetical protein